MPSGRADDTFRAIRIRYLWLGACVMLALAGGTASAGGDGEAGPDGPASTASSST